jgi:hypothetical protein
MALDLDAERINASDALYDLATELRNEAWEWANPSCRMTLLRDARQCETLARTVLATSPLDLAQAVTIAAQRYLATIRSIRLFITAIYGTSADA